MTKLCGLCPECSQQMVFENDLMVSEMKTCSGCQNMLVVDGIHQSQVILKLAPEVEEDWGQ